MMTKKCRMDGCKRFMQLFWVENGASIMPGEGINEGPVAMFYCPSCGEWDDKIILEEYDYIFYLDTIDLTEAEKELTPSEFAALLAEQDKMKNEFLNRRYKIIPTLS